MRKNLFAIGCLILLASCKSAKNTESYNFTQSPPRTSDIKFTSQIIPLPDRYGFGWGYNPYCSWNFQFPLIINMDTTISHYTPSN